MRDPDLSNRDVSLVALMATVVVACADHPKKLQQAADLVLAESGDRADLRACVLQIVDLAKQSRGDLSEMSRIAARGPGWMSQAVNWALSMKNSPLAVGRHGVGC